jgi:1,4-dihydroxy-2-naphthoate octaprenyltransferase
MKLSTFMKALRAPFFTGSIVPVFLGALIAWNHMSTFHWDYFLLTLIGVVLLHAAANTANDYYDHKIGADEVNIHYHTPIYGGSRLIQNGIVEPRIFLIISMSCLALASAIGIYLTITRGLAILWLGLIGVLGGFFYTAPPISLMKRGLGELTIFLNFGVFPTVGAYYVQARSFSSEVFLASIPVGLLMTNVLVINEFPDYQADKQVGKNHLVVRLGKKSARWLYLIILISSYLFIILFALLGMISRFTLLSLLTAPLAIKIGINTWKHYGSYKYLFPSNVGTIVAHLSIGILLCIGYVLQRVL